MSCTSAVCTSSSTGVITGSKGTVYGAAAGDVDGDGIADGLISMLYEPASALNQSPEIVFSKGAGNGTFGAGTAVAGLLGSIPKRIYDLDGDGHPDVAATSVDGRSYMVFWGDAQGAFTQSSALYGMGPGDFDGDGQLDLEVNQNGGCINFGAGGRVFGQRVLLSPVSLGDFADLNKDGAEDVINYNGVSGVVSVYLSTAKQSFVGPPDIQCGAVACTGPTGF
jgi:hypothetical protein